MYLVLQNSILCQVEILAELGNLLINLLKCHWAPFKANYNSNLAYYSSGY